MCSRACGEKELRKESEQIREGLYCHVVVLKAAFCEKERTHRELRQPRRCWRGEMSNETEKTE